MSFAACLVLCFQSGGSGDVLEAVNNRLQQLDGIVLEIRERRYRTPRAVLPLDRSHWVPSLQGALADGHQRRLTIVRPNALLELLTDVPERGYEPVSYSLVDGEVVSHSVRPTQSGRELYGVIDGLPLDIFIHTPILQIFDIHLISSSIPHLNVAGLLGEQGASLQRQVGGIRTYAVSVPMSDLGATFNYEFDLNERGTPIRLKSLYEFRSPSGPQTTLFEREQFTIRTMEVNGAELPAETVIVSDSPGNVSIDYRTILLVEVTSVSVRPELTVADVRIEPRVRNSIISTVRYGGILESQEYDESGRLVASDSSSPEGKRFAGRESLRWRMAIPWAAGTVGLTVAGLLTFASRRRLSR